MSEAAKVDDVICYEVDCDFGKLKVYVQGNFDENYDKTIFLTCHDLGTNYKSWFQFLNHDSMAVARERSVFLHVCVPGQEDNSEALPDDYPFPSLEELGKNLSKVLEYFEIKFVVGMGDGAGANVITRFAIFYPNSCLGIILLNPTSTTASFFERMKVWGMQRKLSANRLPDYIYGYMISHKFGSTDTQSQAVRQYLYDLKNRIKAVNLSRFLDSFVKRSDLSSQLAPLLKTGVLVVSGKRHAHASAAKETHQAITIGTSELLLVDDVADVMNEAPASLSEALILFCQGFGSLLGTNVPDISKMVITCTMEEADKPPQRKFSTGPGPSYN